MISQRDVLLDACSKLSIAARLISEAKVQISGVIGPGRTLSRVQMLENDANGVAVDALNLTLELG